MSELYTSTKTMLPVLYIKNTHQNIVLFLTHYICQTILTTGVVTDRHCVYAYLSLPPPPVPIYYDASVSLYMNSIFTSIPIDPPSTSPYLYIIIT
jgi:hypothetical protein